MLKMTLDLWLDCRYTTGLGNVVIYHVCLRYFGPRAANCQNRCLVMLRAATYYWSLVEVTTISIDILMRTIIVSHVTKPLKISNKCKYPNTEQAAPEIILHLSLFKYVKFNKISPAFRLCVVCCQISHLKQNIIS